MIRRWFVIALLALTACTSDATPTPSPSATSAAPTPTGPPSPTAPPSPSGVPVPATPPAGIVAVTTDGDVVVIELPSLATTTVVTYRPVKAGQPDPETQAFFVTAVTVTPEERILLSTCCEPADGAVLTLNFAGRESKRPPGIGDDPELDPTGRLIARGEIDGLSISPVTGRNIGESFSLTARSTGYFAADPAWSSDSTRIAFTMRGRLLVVDATADSIRGLKPIKSARGTYWGSLAWTSSGLLAARIDGRWGDHGASRIMRVDPASGSVVEVWSSTETITDLATSRDTASYLWVAGGTLHWRIGGVEGSLDGSYDKAAFFPG